MNTIAIDRLGFGNYGGLVRSYPAFQNMHAKLQLARIKDDLGIVGNYRTNDKSKRNPQLVGKIIRKQSSIGHHS